MYFNITIEGLIGSGKSSLMNYIERENNLFIYGSSYLPLIAYEPVDIWTDFNGVDILAEFYSNPDKYGFPFQVSVAQTFIEQNNMLIQRRKDTKKTSVIITDRCVYSGLMTFSKLLDTPQHYVDSLKFLVDNSLKERPNIIVYVNTDVKVCQERMMKRNRGVELSTVSFEYQSKLQQHLEEWIKTEKSLGTFVIELNGNQPTKDIFTELQIKLNSL